MKKYQKIRSLLTLVILMILILSSCNKANLESNLKEVDNEISFISNYSNIANIDAENIYSIIKELSSEKYLGRLAGTKENEMAAQYIADKFKEIGLESPEKLINYMQDFTTQTLIIEEKPVMQIEDKDGNVVKSFEYQKDFLFKALSSYAILDIKAPITKVDNFNDISKLSSDLKDKIALFSNNNINNQYNLSKKIGAINNAGALAGIAEVDVKSDERINSSLVVAPLGGMRMAGRFSPYLIADGDTFNELADAANKDLFLRIKCNFSANFNQEVSNVIGIIPGSDEKLKDEYIIIGAHFDHVGDNKNGTYNPGSLDNASGIAGLLEIARVIKNSEVPPKKTIIFAAFNAEELGLFGSLHYVENPIYPLDKAVMINLDMIGCSADIPVSITTIESSGNNLRDDLIQSAEALNFEYKSSVLSGSDHYNFSKKGVDAVCLINEDFLNGYHSPNDTLEDIDSEKIKQIIRLVLHYIDNQDLEKLNEEDVK
jgi:hypothetical protein